MQGAFNYEGKCEFDLQYLEASKFVNQRLETRSRPEYLYEEEFRRRDGTSVRQPPLELSLSGDGYTVDDTEESKQYNRERAINLSKASRVALLKAFMLNKQMNWLRTVMQQTYKDSIMNWRLPLNHMIMDRGAS